MYISLNIKYLQEKEKLTQNEFGEMFGLGKGVVNSYIAGKATPRLETIMQICKYFNISIDDFVYKELSKQEFLDRGNRGISQNQILALSGEGYGGMIVAELEREISTLKSKLITAYEKIDELKEELEQKNNGGSVQKGA